MMNPANIVPITTAYVPEGPMTTHECLALVEHVERLLARWDTLPENERFPLDLKERAILQMRLDYLLAVCAALLRGEPEPPYPDELALPS